MKTYTYSEARQRLATLLDQARREGEVRIVRKDGSVFVLQPVRSDESPLDVPGVGSRLRPGELVKLLRAERARAGEAVLSGLANTSRKKAKPRRRARKKTQEP